MMAISRIPSTLTSSPRTQQMTTSRTAGESYDSIASPGYFPPNCKELPVWIRIARTEEDLEQAIRVRSQAYSKHIPAAGQRLKAPERFDLAPNATVLIAKRKHDDVTIGTIRIQTNANEGPLNVLAKIPAPSCLLGHTIAEINRLAISPCPESVVAKMALFKACYLYAIALQIDYFVTGARYPVDRSYLSLGFVDPIPGGLTFENVELGRTIHRMLIFDVHAAERKWNISEHPLYDFMIREYHPDIEVFASVGSRWARPRQKRDTMLAHLRKNSSVGLFAWPIA